MPIHVSIHDVSPAFDMEVEHAVALCRARGVRPALLVVPNHHGHAPLTEAPAFVRRVRELAAQGSELFLHGLYHSSADVRASGAFASASTRPRGFGVWFRQSVASAGEAEFGELSTLEAAARLDLGLGMFAELGLPLRGFVPPAWVFPKRLLPELASRGIRYTEDHFGVSDPVSGERRVSGVLNFATRSRLRLMCSTAYVRLARDVLRALPLRIAIHPADMRNPLALRETVRLLDWARGDFVSSVDALLERS